MFKAFLGTEVVTQIKLVFENSSTKLTRIIRRLEKWIDFRVRFVKSAAIFHSQMARQYGS